VFMQNSNNPYSTKTILLERDCEGLLIPHGHPLMLNQGSAVRITQALGDNFTVEVQGNLVMIMGEDRDALGLPPEDPETHAILQDDSVSIEDKCWHQMKRCYDPEIPVNIVELGLIYHCQSQPLPEDSSRYTIQVVMTLTAPTCGMGPILIEEVKRKVMQLDAVQQVEVELVFDPPWSKDNMSSAAKLTLGMM
jgi:probable FeS assembly SUF system protein SufT